MKWLVQLSDLCIKILHIDPAHIRSTDVQKASRLKSGGTIDKSFPDIANVFNRVVEYYPIESSRSIRKLCVLPDKRIVTRTVGITFSFQELEKDPVAAGIVDNHGALSKTKVFQARKQIF